MKWVLLPAPEPALVTSFRPLAQDTQFKLESTGMAAACLHGEMSKMERQTVLAKFKAGAYRALVRSQPIT